MKLLSPETCIKLLSATAFCDQTHCSVSWLNLVTYEPGGVIMPVLSLLKNAMRYEMPKIFFGTMIKLNLICNGA